VLTISQQKKKMLLIFIYDGNNEFLKFEV